MRNLGKKLKTTSETIEAYACPCGCVCICAPVSLSAGDSGSNNYSSWEHDFWLG